MCTIAATHKTIALAIDLCVYPPMLLDIVTKETVKPTDWQLTSQNETRRPHVLDRGRYAIHAALIVQRALAAVATSSREFGTFNVIAPPIHKATT